MNLDFLLLVESGLFVMMSIGAVALARLEPTRRWSLIALFALAHVIFVWAQLVEVDLGENPWTLSLQFIALAAGNVSLAEFVGRFSGISARFPRARFAIHTLITLVAWATAWRWGASGVGVFLCFTGTVTAGFAGWIFLQSARIWSAWATAWRLRAVAALLPIYLLAATLPLAIGSGDTAASGLPFPLRMLGLVLASALSLVVYVHNAILQKRRLPEAAARGWRRRRYLCIGVVWIVVIAGWIIAARTAERQDASMRQQILDRTALAGAAIQRLDLNTLTWSDTDAGQPGYERLKQLMIALRSANRDVRFALLAGLAGGQAYFLVDSELPSSADYSPPGQAYTEAAPDYLHGMADGKPFVLGPVADRWGTWVMGSVPLLKLPDGRSVNMELDVAAQDWAQLIHRSRLPVVLITLLIAVLIIGFFQAQERLHDSALQTSLSEQRMRTARDAAEAATRAKSEFLAVMSHELRTPLAGVIGMLDLLRRSPPAAARKKYVTVARDSAETLLHILDDILDSAKIEAGRLTLESIPFRPRDTFQALCEAARLRAETKSVDLGYTITPAVPEVLIGDPTRLRQVLGNLQNNALKFTEHGEVSVLIDARPIDAASVLLLVSVRDTGCGIAEEHRARLFGKFEQADRSTTRRYGGTGLGLSIVKALADTMGGSIDVQSVVGQGSTFTFAAPLPLGRASDVPSASEADAVSFPPPAVRLKILCAEDDAVNRLVAEAVITRLGHCVEFAENGERALELLRQHRYDLVLMDGRMPVLDGFRATRMIRSGDSGVLDPNIYICAATANVAASDKQRCTAAGMNDYVKKPLSDHTVFEALARATAWLDEHHVAPVLTTETAPAAGLPAGLSEAELLAQLEPDAAPPAPSPETGFSPAMQQRLASLFWAQAPAQVATLRAACAAGDLPQVADVAHALKSAAHYASALELSRNFARLEKLASDGTRQACEQLLRETETEFERLRPGAAAVPTA